MSDNRSTRRDFLKTSAVAGATLAANTTLAGGYHAAGSDTIKVGIIGCGGRGSGAGRNVLQSAPNVQVMAIGDPFKFRVDACRKALTNMGQNDATVKKLNNTVDLPEDRCFTGIDAYQKVIDSGANYIILATPPGFRPVHLAAAIKAGKNIFTEKPVAVDFYGAMFVMHDLYNAALGQKLNIVAGTQRRHQHGYLEAMKRVHGGEIGEIVAMRCFWNGGGIWFRERKELMEKNEKTTDVAYQLHNWYHWIWTCGDHIVEQHVHNLDVCNWAMKGMPTKAVGFGGRLFRQQGDPREVGNIYDHFTVDFEYANGTPMMSQCRHFDGVSNVSEEIIGTKGKCMLDDRKHYLVNGKPAATVDEDKAAGDPYVREHTDLINCIRQGKYINELQSVAQSTLTAITGREACYTGRPVDLAKLDKLWKENRDEVKKRFNTMPEGLTFDSKLTVADVPRPGRTKPQL